MGNLQRYKKSPLKCPFTFYTLTFSLVSCFYVDPCIGPALVPYFRQILPPLKIFCNKNTHKLDGIDYSRSGRLGDLIDQTLMLLERCGGPSAYINIKNVFPTYESCVNN